MSWHGAPPKRLLLTSDRDTQNSQDSAFSSHIMSSQIQDSQCSDFSQVATQDMFSQSNSGPQTEGSTQQQCMKKMSMYEKWLSKRAMFKRDPPQLTSVDSKINVQGTTVNSSNTIVQAQGYFGTSGNSNAMTRPIVDTSLRGVERELLKQVTFAIHDCSSEMKSALFTVKEKLENVTEISNEQLAQTLTSFLDDIWKHQEKLQQLLQEQDKGRSVVTELEVKLAKKESQIATLEEQLVQARKDDTSRFARAVRCEMQSPQLLLQTKLEKILEWTKDTTEQQGHHLKEYKHSMEEQSKQYVNLIKAGQSNLKDAEKKLILSELRKIPDKLEFKERELYNHLTEDMKNCLEIYKSDFEEMMRHLIQQGFNQHLRGSDRGITALQKGSIQDIFKTQLEAISRNLGDAIKSNTVKNNEQFANIQSTLCGNIQQIKDLLQYKCLETDAIAQLESRLSQFHSAMTQQLSKIESRYLGEIKELQNELYKQTRFSADREITEEQENVRGRSNIYLHPSCMKDSTSSFTSTHLLSGQTRNNLQQASTSASAINKVSASASKDSKINGHVDNNDLHKRLQTYKQDFNKYHKHLTEITHSSMSEVIPNSAVFGNARNPVKMAPENFLDQKAVHCHPFGKCESPFKSKSNPIAPFQRPESHKKMSTQHSVPGAHCESSTISPLPKKMGNRKRAAKSKKDMSTKYVENMTVIHTQAGCSSQTGMWTRSHYKSVKQVQAPPQNDFQRANNGCKFMDGKKYSWPSSENKTVKHGTTKGDLSIYNFTESDTGNQPVFPRKREHASSEAMENMSLASFISNGCIGEKKNKNSEDCSERSSPTISITEVTIRRKVRTPFRRPFNKGVLPKLDFDRMSRLTSAPTLLSEISSKQ